MWLLHHNITVSRTNTCDKNKIWIFDAQGHSFGHEKEMPRDSNFFMTSWLSRIVKLNARRKNRRSTYSSQTGSHLLHSKLPRPVSYRQHNIHESGEKTSPPWSHGYLSRLLCKSLEVFKSAGGMVSIVCRRETCSVQCLLQKVRITAWTRSFLKTAWQAQ